MPVIDINGLRVHYNDTGRGAPVVFVPGLAGSGDWFHYQSSGLADRFRVITYDLRKARGGYSLDLLTDDLNRLLLALKLYNAAVVGYSLGGMIALNYALAHPDRCPALVLCSSAPNFPDLTDAEFTEQLLPDGARASSFWDRVRSRMQFWRKNSTKEDEADSLASHGLADLDRTTLAARLRLMRETDLAGVLREVEVPTLVVASSGDMPYVLAGSQALHESIPDSVLEVTENTDRFYFHSRHDLFNAILADYLAEAIARF